MLMANSVEGRFPFLDVRLVEFCNALDERLKLRGLTEKYLLKRAAQPWLPDIIRQRPKRPYRAPNGARNHSGTAPVWVSMARCASESSLSIKPAERRYNAGCVWVWFPIA